MELLLLFNCPFNFAAGFTRLDGCAAIILLFPLCQRQLHLRVATFREVDPQGNDSQTLELGLPHQLVDLLPMQKQFPLTQGIMVRKIAV